MHIPYQLIRSDRRTLSLTVDGRGLLIARAPRRMPLNEIEAFIALKEGWISRKQALASAARAQYQPFCFARGALLPWLDDALSVQFGAFPFGIDFHGALLLPASGDPAAHARAWRKQRASDILGPRVQGWSELTGLRPSVVSYGEARTRWGSMSARGGLRLNVALLHCPAACIDYVIVHELSHILHPNHSAAFYAQVARTLPDAEARRALLRQMTPRISLLCSADPKEGL